MKKKEEENNIRNCKTCGVRNEAISHTGTNTNTHRKQLSIYLVYITIPNGAKKNTNNLTSYWCYRAYYINDHRTSVELQQNVDVRRDERSSTDNVQWTKIDKRKQKTRKKAVFKLPSKAHYTWRKMYANLVPYSSYLRV